MELNLIEEPIATEEISVLRTTVRSSWITSVKAIYEFAKTHSQEAIKRSLLAHGLKTTKKANTFTGAAKLGLSELVDGEWTACDIQVSRYSKVCQHLNENQVAVDDVESFLADKTMTELVQNKSEKEAADEPSLKNAVELIEKRYPVSDALSFEGENVAVKPDANLVSGVNIAVVICDMVGNIVAIHGLDIAINKAFRSHLISLGGSQEDLEETKNTGDIISDAVNATLAA